VEIATAARLSLLQRADACPADDLAAIGRGNAVGLLPRLKAS
jgi:hypothetical protein